VTTPERCSLDKRSSSYTYKVRNSEADVHTALPGTNDNLVQSGGSAINVDGETTIQQCQRRNTTYLQICPRFSFFLRSHAEFLLTQRPRQLFELDLTVTGD
jgi:hypothetical protein